MKILHVTRVLQHPELKGSARHYYFLRELAARHEITLLTRSLGRVPDSVLTEVKGMVEKLVVVEGMSEGRWRRYRQDLKCIREMKGHLDRLATEERYDVLLFHGKDVYPAVMSFNGVPFVIDFCDATSMRIRSRMRFASPLSLPFQLANYAKMRWIEKKMLSKTSEIAFISRRDRQAIVGRKPGPAVVPNGVDLQYWRRTKPYQPQGVNLVFTGVMSYPPNADAANLLIREVMPEVVRRFPASQLMIVGKDPSSELKELGAVSRGVTVTGTVEDLRPYLEEATVFACPIRIASGMQNKALEAMAMEVPVVTLPAVSDGLAIEEDTDVPVVTAQTVSNFTEQVVGLIENPKRCADLARAGRRFVETHASWSTGAEQLEQMCERAVRDWNSRR